MKSPSPYFFKILTLENGTSGVSSVPTRSGISSTELRPKYFYRKVPYMLFILLNLFLLRLMSTSNCIKKGTLMKTINNNVSYYALTGFRSPLMKVV